MNGAVRSLRFLLGALWIARAGAVLPAAAAAGEMRPNVVLISIDTLRRDRLGCYGYGAIETPAMDGLAGRGTRFLRAYSHATFTLPSHVTLFTSLYPLTHRILDFRVRVASEAFPLTLTDVLHRSGYVTAAFTGGTQLSADYGFGRGFETYLERREDDFSFRKAGEWLDRGAFGAGHKPFFLFLHTYAVSDVITRIKYRQGLECGSSPGFTDMLIKNYDLEVARTDGRLGDFLRLLEEKGLRDSTIVVLVSDHGDSFCQEHDDGSFVSYGHGAPPYEEQIQVPLILRVPEKLAPAARKAEVRDPVGLIDVAPTLLELCGIEVPGSFQGRSLVPLMSGSPLPARPIYALGGRRHAPVDFAQWDVEARALLEGNRKYIGYQAAASPGEYYELDSDPRETRNRIGRKEAERLRRSLRRAEAAFGWDKQAATPKSTPIEMEKIHILKSLGYLQ